MEIDICLNSEMSSARTAELAVLAEECGVRGVWNTCSIDGRDPFANLVEAAMATTTIAIGPMALSPYEMHPFRLAIDVLTLNEIAGGRAQLAIGTGADVLEPAGLTAERPVRHLREALDIVRAATSERPVDYRGSVYSLTGFDPSWVTASAPELVACAMGRQTIGVAVTRCAGIMLSDFTPALITATAELAAAAAAERGAPRPIVNSFQPLFLYPDRDEARRHAFTTIAWRALGRRYITGDFLDDGEFEILLANMPVIYEMASTGVELTDPEVRRILDRCVDELTLVGSTADIDDVVSRLREFEVAASTAWPSASNSTRRRRCGCSESGSSRRWRADPSSAALCNRTRGDGRGADSRVR